MLTSQFEEAAVHFERAVENWQALDYAIETAAALHNLAVARAAANSDDRDPPLRLLAMARELRYQLNDEPGMKLIDANMAKLYGDRGSLENVKYWFEGNGLPQFTVIQEWLSALE
jgi:hypothetical protein